MLSVYTVPSREAAQPEMEAQTPGWGIVEVVGFTTVRREEQVYSQGSADTGEGSVACEWGFLGAEDQKVPECHDWLFGGLPASDWLGKGLF